MDAFAEAVAGAVQDRVLVPGLQEHLPRGVIDLAPAGKATGVQCRLDRGDRRVASPGDGVERARHLDRHPCPGVRHPRDVGVHGARNALLAPEIKKHELVAADRLM